jgi:hypothetical protein
MAIILNSFGGILPKIDKRILPNDRAQVAQNCLLKSGHLIPFKDASLEQTISPDIKTIFPYQGSWLTWNQRVSVAPSMVISDAYSRLYYTGDGGLPKMRGIAGGVQVEHILGIPKPTNTASALAQAPSSVSWTRSWFYQYEEPDGRVSETGSLVEGAYGGTNVNQVIPGETYQIETAPAVGAATASAVLVIFCDIYDAGGSYLGRVYSDISFYKDQSSGYIGGAQVSIEQDNSTGTPAVSMAMVYDTSRISDYVKERSYVYTLVSDWGEEGPPSTPSEEIVVSPNEEVILSGMDDNAPYPYGNVSKKRIYRTATSSAGTFFYFVAEIPIADASYTDLLTDASLGEVLSTEGYFPPDDALTGLIALQSGFYVGFVGRTVKHSYPYLPYAWNPAYDIEAKNPVVAVVEAPGGYYILTQDEPEMVQGTGPEDIQRISIQFNQGCSSRHGVVKYGGSVLYPSPDGIVSLSGLSPSLVTSNVFTREQWAAFSPSTMIGAIHDGQYHLVSENTHLIWDIETGMFVTSDVRSDAFYVNNQEDLLYYVLGQAIYKWRQGTDYLTLKWRSREFSMAMNSVPACCRVDAEVYPVTLRLLADDAEVLELTLNDDRARKLPMLRRERYWAIEVESAGQINTIRVGKNIRELA